MATKRIVKKTVARIKARTKTTPRKVSKNVKATVNANPVKKAVLAGLGAAARTGSSAGRYNWVAANRGTRVSTTYRTWIVLP